MESYIVNRYKNYICVLKKTFYKIYKIKTIGIFIQKCKTHKKYLVKIITFIQNIVLLWFYVCIE